MHRYADRPLFARELAVLAAERGLRVVDLPGRRDRTRPTTRVPCCTTSPTSPTATSTSADPRSGPSEVRRAALAAGLPPEHLHVETFGW